MVGELQNVPALEPRGELCRPLIGMKKVMGPHSNANAGPVPDMEGDVEHPVAELEFRNAFTQECRPTVERHGTPQGVIATEAQRVNALTCVNFSRVPAKLTTAKHLHRDFTQNPERNPSNRARFHVLRRKTGQLRFHVHPLALTHVKERNLGL